MRRPHWRSAMFTAMSGAVGLALLAGCATQRSGRSAADETSFYLRNASGRYVIPGPPSDPWGPYVREASRRFDMPESWIRALMRQESGGHLYQGGQLITSSAGAMGLMQVMPGTYAELRARHNLGPDPFDPHENIMAGVAYMREMYDMYGSPGFLAAYNAGPNRLDDYLANQRGLPDETRHYVAAIGPSLQYAQPQHVSPAQQFAMNQLPLNIPAGPRYGYGTSVQYASAPAYSQPVFTRVAAQPVYTPPSQPRAVAWAQPQPRPVYTYTPPAQPAAVAWSAPPKPVYTAAPVQAYSPPPQRTEVARIEPRDEEEISARRSQGSTHHAENTRVAFAALPQQHGSHLHLISSAMAAEVYTTRRGRKTITEPVSFNPPEHEHHAGPTWKLHASGPLQPAPVCHKSAHGKMVCGPERL
jgi:hypothetical protein